MKNFLRWLFFAWFTFVLFDSPIRYILNKLSIIYFYYIKDIFLLIIIIYEIIAAMKSLRVNKIFLIIIGMLVLGIFIGLINHLNFLQILFGVKIYLPLLAGIIIIKHNILKSKDYILLYRISIPTIIIGLGLEYYKLLPWSGFNYSLGNFTIEGNRYWTTFGVQRLSGFQRASFDSGIIIVLLNMFYFLSLIDTSKETIKLHFYKKTDIILFLLSIIGIILTTSKSSLFAVLILIIVFILIDINLKSKDLLIKKLTLVMIKFTVTVLFLYAIIPPIISLININYIQNIDLSNKIFKWLFTSYIDRMNNTWPKAFSLLLGSYFYLLGRGIGGIGAPQQYFESYLYNPGDNVFVYLYITFGYLTLGLIIWLIVHIAKINIKSINNILMIFFLLILFSFGATLNVIESPFLLLSIGMLVSSYYKQ
jgi:hypothetical protein